MEIALEGVAFTNKDGSFTIPDLGVLHPTAVLNAVIREMKHVFGNEAISKGSTAKAKDASLTDEAYNKIVADARDAYFASMKAGTWGFEKAGGAKMPAANRLEQIFNMLCAEATRKALAGMPAGSAKDTWIGVNEDGEQVEVTLREWMGFYLANEELGEARKADLDRRAKIKYDAEMADAEIRKASKAREAGTARTAGLSL
jgi:hypothetical protein